MGLEREKETQYCIYFSITECRFDPSSPVRWTPSKRKFGDNLILCDDVDNIRGTPYKNTDFIE